MSQNRKLIVRAVFDRNERGELVPTLDPRQIDTIEHALQEAKLTADRHTGVIVWMREADPYLVEYGPPMLLFQSGDIPDLDDRRAEAKNKWRETWPGEVTRTNPDGIGGHVPGPGLRGHGRRDR